MTQMAQVLIITITDHNTPKRLGASCETLPLFVGNATCLN